MSRIRHLDGPTPLQWLLGEIERMGGCADTKANVLALLRAAAGQRLYVSKRDVVAPFRVAQARALLATGVPATEVRRRMAIRFECSQDTAERIVLQALQHGSAAPAPRHAQLPLALDDGAD